MSDGRKSTFSLDEIEPPPLRIRGESFPEKLLRKGKEEPFVPIGCVATTYFLVSGFNSFRHGDAVRSQKMMKGRVMAQGATIAALAMYAGYSSLGGYEKIAEKLTNYSKIAVDTYGPGDEKGKGK
eukprot:CAMPEP_0194270728 /NCGR_PEP_ID=MMETSP0169-20130528/4653_1 /TAXON_ID=218684 /ORGANISM="Corethron pennatum, Strain L29A3" /LENGTH=124 /DNA_ID=CAMNT_0039012869 /DNA_START=198 /DNA_END=572 /DNA_ORIENTATION=+